MSHLEQNSGVLKPHRGWSSLVAVCLFLSLQSPPGAADKGPSGLEEGVPGTALLPGEKDTGEEVCPPFQVCVAGTLESGCCPSICASGHHCNATGVRCGSADRGFRCYVTYTRTGPGCIPLNRTSATKCRESDGKKLTPSECFKETTITCSVPYREGPSGLEEGVPGTALLPGEKDTGEEGRERVYLVITATAVLVLFALLAAAVAKEMCFK